ncbi:MAG: hypothetical protein S4CHLAM20_14850 [Chlamydiia bacterium]|nr:hypothetical protein [Chlamydiia bacterium]
MLALRSLPFCSSAALKFIPSIRTMGDITKTFSIVISKYNSIEGEYEETEMRSYDCSNRHKLLQVAYKILKLSHPGDQKALRNLFAYSPPGTYRFKKHSCDFIYGIEIDGDFLTPADALITNLPLKKDEARKITQYIFSNETTNPKGVAKTNIHKDTLSDYPPSHHLPALFETVELCKIWLEPNPFPFEVNFEENECQSLFFIDPNEP